MVQVLAKYHQEIICNMNDNDTLLGGLGTVQTEVTVAFDPVSSLYVGLAIFLALALAITYYRFTK